MRRIQVRENAIYAKFSDNEKFCDKISLKKGYRFDHDNWYINNTEIQEFQQELKHIENLQGLVP